MPSVPINLAFLRKNELYPAERELYPAQRQGKTMFFRFENEVYPLAVTPQNELYPAEFHFATIHVTIKSPGRRALCIALSERKRGLSDCTKLHRRLLNGPLRKGAVSVLASRQNEVYPVSIGSPLPSCKATITSFIRSGSRPNETVA